MCVTGELSDFWCWCECEIGVCDISIMLPWLLNIYMNGCVKEMNESQGKGIMPRQKVSLVVGLLGGFLYPILRCYMYLSELSSTAHIHDCSVMLHINVSNTCES